MKPHNQPPPPPAENPSWPTRYGNLLGRDGYGKHAGGILSRVTHLSSSNLLNYLEPHRPMFEYIFEEAFQFWSFMGYFSIFNSTEYKLLFRPLARYPLYVYFFSRKINKGIDHLGSGKGSPRVVGPETLWAGRQKPARQRSDL